MGRNLRAWALLSGVIWAIGCGDRAEPVTPKSAPDTDPAQYPQPYAQPSPPPAMPGMVPAPSPIPELSGPKPDPARVEPKTAEDAHTALGNAEDEIDKLLATPNADALSADRCTRLCAALGSMRRAVDSLCGLTRADDERCERARKRLENSERRVTNAGCAC